MIRIRSLAVTPLIVGRGEELETLHSAAAALVEGYGSFLHVTGEAGIGKTSLLASAVAELARHDIPVRLAAADETDRRRRASVLRALLPDLDFRAADDPLDVALAEFERLAGVGPLAVVADDVHWADNDSVEALRALGRRAGRLGMLLITAARPQPPTNAVRRLQDDAVALGACLRPESLDAVALAALAAARFDAPPGPRLNELLATTGGNPFMATELLTHLADQQLVVRRYEQAELDETGGAIPVALSDRLASRALSSIDGGDLLLRAIAAVPGGLAPDELAPLLDRPLSDVLTVSLRGVEAGLLTDTGATLAFRHELLRQSIVEVTPETILRTMSRRAADVLIDQKADPERVTVCLLTATDPDDPGDVDRLVAVGTAIAASHPSAAADLLVRALAGMGGRDEREPEVALAAGWALIAGGRASEVDALLETLGRAPEVETVVFERLRGIAASLCGRLELVAVAYDGSDIDRLETRYDTSDPAVVDAAAELALLRVSRGQLAEARALVEWVERSPTASSAFRQATIATVRGWLASATGHFDAAVTHARTALRCVGQDTTRSATETPPTLMLAASLDHLGDGDGALHVVRTLLASRSLARWGVPLLQYFAAVALYRRGEWDDALAEVEAGLIAADETTMRMSTFWPDAVLAVIAVARGQPEGAHGHLDHAAARSGHSLGGDWIRFASALSAEADGELDRAAATVDAVIDSVDSTGALTVLLNGGPELARIALAAGRPGVADRIATGLGDLRARTSSPIVGAMSTWTAGLMSSSAGPIADAAEMLDGVHRIPEAARARHHAAVIAAREGDASEARRLAKQAFAGYDVLAAEGWHRQLRADLQACGLPMRPRRRLERAETGWPSLTASEQSIVELVGTGLTNTEIAARLFVSRRTVESHLGRVYTKLGLGTRGQLVAAVARRLNEP